MRGSMRAVSWSPPTVPVQVLVGAEALDHVDLHVQRRAAVRHAVGDRLRPEPERAFRPAPAAAWAA